MPNLTSKARAGRLAAIAGIAGRKARRRVGRGRALRISDATFDAGPSPRNIFL